MAKVIFNNRLGRDAYLHMRVGPVDVHPDDRGSSNTVIKVDDGPLSVQVFDGDVWFCFGNQVVNHDDNPPLCNAAGGTTVQLNSALPCYADN